MKFSCTQLNLKQSLYTVSHIAGKNINLPILSNVLIKVDGGQIQFMTTDLEIGISHIMRGKVEKDGMFTTNSKLLSDYISLLPNERVDIELIGTELKISCQNYKTKIKGEEASDYPVIPKVEKKDFFSFDFEVFKKSVNEVIFSAATNETRIELSGVYFEFNKGSLIIAATDSYRLAEKKIKYKEKKENNEEIKKIIIPTKTLQEVTRLLANIDNELTTEDKENDIKIYLSDNQVLFVYDDSELVSRVIEGQYPNYQQIIPQANLDKKTEITINRTEFLRAIKASSLFSKTAVNDVNIDTPKDKQKVVISALNNQSGESVVDVSAKVDGRDNGVVLNYRYLIDGLQNISTESVVMEIVDANTPCVLKPDGKDDYLYIIMPIKH